MLVNLTRLSSVAGQVAYTVGVLGQWNNTLVVSKKTNTVDKKTLGLSAMLCDCLYLSIAIWWLVGVQVTHLVSSMLVDGIWAKLKRPNYTLNTFHSKMVSVILGSSYHVDADLVTSTPSWPHRLRMSKMAVFVSGILWLHFFIVYLQSIGLAWSESDLFVCLVVQCVHAEHLSVW